MPPHKRKAESGAGDAPNGKISKDDAALDGGPDGAPDSAPAADGSPAAFPAVTPSPDDATQSPDRPPSPLTPTDDGRGVILDPEAGREHMVLAPAGELGTPIAARGDDGREYLADYRPAGGADGGGEVRWAVSVIETKVPYDQRPTRGLLDTDEQIADRRYEAVVRPLDPDDPTSQRGAPDAPDDDPAYPVGTTAWWRAYLTEQEVARLRAADNVESVTYEHKIGPVGSEWAARFTGSDFDGPAWRAREARRAAGGEQQ